MMELFAGKLRTQFIIATHYPFFLSLKDATIYDLDSHYEVFGSDTNLRRVDFLGGVTGVTTQTFWNCPKLEYE
jgi:predicted ATPase